MNQKTLIIVPTYNERENLPSLVKRIMAQPAAWRCWWWTTILGRHGAIGGRNRQQEPDGPCAAPGRKKTGWAALISPGSNGRWRGTTNLFSRWTVISRIIRTMSLRFLQAAQQGADLVLGSRYSNGIRVINWPLRRLMLSMGAGNTSASLPECRSPIRPGLQMFPAPHPLKSQPRRVRSNGYSFQIELTHKIWRQGMKVVEVPIVFTDRFQGTSKMSRKIVREAFLMVWRLLFQNKLRRSPQTSNTSH